MYGGGLTCIKLARILSIPKYSLIFLKDSNAIVAPVRVAGPPTLLILKWKSFRYECMYVCMDTVYVWLEISTQFMLYVLMYV